MYHVPMWQEYMPVFIDNMNEFFSNTNNVVNSFYALKMLPLVGCIHIILKGDFYIPIDHSISLVSRHAVVTSVPLLS
jgi:hypothetical protein